MDFGGKSSSVFYGTTTTQSLHHQYHMSFEHYGRGSDAKGIHFYQTIQLRHLQDQELVSIINIHLFLFS
jgi:hypothetical protein